jgi:ribosomal protein S18 acetylase RimI-like enzyme
MYFNEKYMPFSDELTRRCIFIENSAGEKVATSTAWWEQPGGKRSSWIHWVAVDPRFQGLGLGKAVISQAIRLLTEIDGDIDKYLHTQTWSHKAVEIYKMHGFEPTNEKELYNNKQDNYRKAMRVLKKLH